jgi:Protease inhibitor Inh
MMTHASKVGRAARVAAAAAAVALLAGCSTNLGPSGGPAPAAAPVRAEPPPPDMAGRWMLSAAAGSACRVNLVGAPGASEGAIRPEGGCPGDFFTSRKWTFEDGTLVIRNHNNEPLGRLTMAAPGRFEGQSTGGQPVSLAR